MASTTTTTVSSTDPYSLSGAFSNVYTVTKKEYTSMCVPAMLAAIVVVIAALADFVQVRIWQGFVTLLVGLIVVMLMQWSCSAGQSWIAWLLLVIPIVIYIIMLCFQMGWIKY